MLVLETVQLSEIYISCLLTLPISGDHNSRLALFEQEQFEKDRSCIVKFATEFMAMFDGYVLSCKEFLNYERLRVIKIWKFYD